ncbi:MAG: hypothetical protein AAB656_03020 [Patescibacteria group bacterium]
MEAERSRSDQLRRLLDENENISVYRDEMGCVFVNFQRSDGLVERSTVFPCRLNPDQEEEGIRISTILIDNKRNIIEKKGSLDILPGTEENTFTDKENEIISRVKLGMQILSIYSNLSEQNRQSFSREVVRDELVQENDFQAGESLS